jgi:hypothetical protein
MGVLRNLINGLRGAVGPSATALQRGRSIYGSAYAPAPPTLHVPEELRRAVDEENLRKATSERSGSERPEEQGSVTPRLARRIALDFPDAARASEVMRVVAEAASWERVQAAIVLSAAGDLHLIHAGADLAGIDWRDVLVNGGLENDDWGLRLDSELGPGA